MQLYNTLTRKKETFTPIDGKTARIYSCGPTVYNTATIGNLRAYVCADILKKTIKLAGFEVYDVMNITDVGHLVTDADEGEDKVETAARKANTTPQAIAQKYTQQFFADCELLNIRKPKVIVPATDCVPEMIEFVKRLEQKGFTYTTSDGVYFDSSKFPNYNKLSQTPIENNKAGARVDIGEKRNANDFALWKFVGEHSMQKWYGPWTPAKRLGSRGSPPGCPGWHLECSAIALKYLGETFDIHTGGIDHIPIHHTNEIAQTESLTGKPMSKFWIHNEFMTIDGGKMSKSLGNAYTLAELEARGFSPMSFRYYCLLAHYRSILNFTWEGLQAAQNAYNNLVTQLSKHAPALTSKPDSPLAKRGGTPMGRDGVCDDLNTPKVLASIWEMVKQPPSRDIYNQIIEYDKVLSLNLENAVAEYLAPKKIPLEIIELVNKRLRAKKDKDFTLADKLRAEILKLGYEIKDTKDGFELTKI